MQGTLMTVCLPDLLRTIYTERHSGELILTQGSVKKQIYFELGQIVFAASNQKEDRIGEALVRHNKLTRAQLDQFVSTLGRGKRLGKALVEQGVLTDRELVTYVTFQLIDIIYSLFTWTLGNYEFAEGESNRAPEELKLKFSTATIILEGVRRIEDFDIIRRGLGDLNRLIAPSASPLLRLQTITLKPLERQVLDLVTQPIDILRVLIGIQDQPQKVLKALYGLLSVGLLQQVGSAEISATTGKFTVPETVKQQAAVAPPVQSSINNADSFTNANTDSVQNEIAIIKTRIATQDPRAILGVSGQATISEIRDAYYRMATMFHPDKFIQSPRSVRADVEFIFTNITESYNTLRGVPPMAARPSANSAVNTHDLAPAPAYPGQRQNYQPGQNQSTPMKFNISDPRLAPPPPGYQPSSMIAPPPTIVPPPANYSGSTVSRGATRAISDEVDYPGYQMHKLPQRSNSRGNVVDVEVALNDLIDYLDDRKAPLFVADSLSTLLRTSAPLYVEPIRVVEAVVMWAREKASLNGRPLHEMFISVLNSIKHAEQARVIRDFDAKQFYTSFIQELVNYCPPMEKQDFLAKADTI
ncbi:MAG: DUF4388 domain-containing protein [Acidobacteriota bacterium]